MWLKLCQDARHLHFFAFLIKNKNKKTVIKQQISWKQHAATVEEVAEMPSQPPWTRNVLRHFLSVVLNGVTVTVS